MAKIKIDPRTDIEDPKPAVENFPFFGIIPTRNVPEGRCYYFCTAQVDENGFLVGKVKMSHPMPKYEALNAFRVAAGKFWQDMELK